MFDRFPFLSDRAKRWLDLFAATVAIGVSLAVLATASGKFLRVAKEEYVRSITGMVASVRDIAATPPAFEITVVGHKATFVYGECGDVADARRAVAQPGAVIKLELDPIPIDAGNPDRFRVLALDAPGFSKTYNQCLRAMGSGLPAIFKIVAIPILLGAAYRFWRATRLVFHR